LKIILFGQPELDELLNAPQLRQVKDRISHRFVLQPLDAAEAMTYLGFRLRKAGLNGSDIFEPEACKLLWQASEGRTRKLNMLAEKSLLAAYASGSSMVNLDHARRATQDEATELRRLPSAQSALDGLPGNMATSQNSKGTSRFPMRLRFGGALVLAALVGYGASYVTLEPQRKPVVAEGVVSQAATAVAPVTVAQATSPVMTASVVVTPTVEATSATSTPSTPLAVPVAPAALTATSAPAVAAVIQPAPAAPGEKGGTLSDRIQASEAFIAQTRGIGYTVQVLALRAPRHDQLAEMLADYREQLGTQQPILVNDRAYNGVPHHAVYVGQFASREAAVDYIATLPESMRRQRPLVRSFARILEEPKS
jgi:MSHA biogenesis protein MshM